MDCFIKKIFDNKIDELVHLQFQKFSKGTFAKRALFKASTSNKGYNLSTGNEYVNDFVRIMAQKLGNDKTHVTGVIVSTSDLKNKIPYSDLKQFMGIKQYVINSEMSGNDLAGLLNDIPEAFFALSLSVGSTILKIKAKAPKSAKPKTSEEPPKPDFCSLKTQDKDIIEHFIMERGWKKIEGEHTFVITDIELPRDVTDPNEMRKLAKRKGKIIRKVIVDGKEHVTEKDFIA